LALVHRRDNLLRSIKESQSVFLSPFLLPEGAVAVPTSARLNPDRDDVLRLCFGHTAILTYFLKNQDKISITILDFEPQLC